MKYLFAFLFLTFFTLTSIAQNPGDTIIVETINYNTDSRDTTVQFPSDPNLTFEKIIMAYNMRCKDNVVNYDGNANHIGCGAWDYSCHTYIHDSTKVDSLLSFHKSYTITNFNENSYNYTTTPVFNFTQYIQQNVTVNNISNENIFQIGTSNEQLENIIGTNHNAFKSQFLFKSEELINAGMINDSIDALSFLVSTQEEVANFLKIKLQLTEDSILDANNPVLEGFTEVYSSNTILQNGINKFYFNEGFDWDSTSNIIVEFSLYNSTAGNTTTIEGSSIDSMGIYSNDGKCIKFSSSGNISVPNNSFSSIENEITISFWANGNADALPQNTSIIEAFDQGGNRTVNIHFPWSNSRIYFDCGNEESSYDRIEKDANLNEYAGNWNHWVFTKNAISGEQNIYRNGVLWHSGSEKNKTINIHSFKIGSNGNGGNPWNGLLKELRVYNKEVSQENIIDWMNLRMNSNHPDFSNLVAYYPLNEGQGFTVNDQSTYNQNGNFENFVSWENERGDKLSTFFNQYNFRPNLSFYQAEYDLTFVIDTVLDSTMALQNVVKGYEIITNNNETFGEDSIANISTNYYWQNVSSTYNEFGEIIESETLESDGTIEITDLQYYKRYPMAFQIMSFVTPYGAGLDLGEFGKTWYFDVTDFGPILKDNRRIVMGGGGQWQEEMDIKFYFIVGTPTREVKDINQIWRVTSKGYTDIVDNTSFEPRDIYFPSDASSFKIRGYITGHGQEGEFIPRTHTFNLNNSSPTSFSKQVWTACAENPVYPQGGTWIYDRAGWCPGQATDLWEEDITSLVTPGQTHTLDYGLNSASGSSSYWVSWQLVNYGAPNFNIDARIIDIVSPTKSIKHFRKNPTCSKPEITIQNNGTSAITSVEFKYSVNNGDEQTYTWNGNLNFLEKTNIRLDNPDELWANINPDGENTFMVEITKVNNYVDEYEFNNKMSSAFDVPDSAPHNIELWFKTNNGVINNQGVSESSWKFIDADDNVIYSSGTLYYNTTYKDTLFFTPGCYTFIVEDTDDDGIDFWANNDGVGYARLKKFNAGWLKMLEGDFGKNSFYQFKVETTSEINEQSNLKIGIFPNPTTDNIFVNGNVNEINDITIINSIGEVLRHRKVNNSESPIQISLEDFTNGIYFININQGAFIEKIVKL